MFAVWYPASEMFFSVEDNMVILSYSYPVQNLARIPVFLYSKKN